MTASGETGSRTGPGREAGGAQASAQFLEFLQMVGPDAAERVLRQFLLDLTACDLGLAEALTGPDWLAIRSRSHVLIALAGTVGASDLHRMAAELNAIAQHPPADAGAALALIAAIRQALAEVLGVVQRLLANRGQAA